MIIFYCYFSNPEQKIKHITKLKEENNRLKEEKVKLMETLEKLTSENGKNTKEKETKSKNEIENVKEFFKLYISHFFHA